jgi:excisionase family DNA binding protein
MAHIDSAPAPIAVSINEASKMLRINRRALDQAVREKRIPVAKIGVKRRVLISDLEDWLRLEAEATALYADWNERHHKEVTA